MANKTTGILKQPKQKREQIITSVPKVEQPKHPKHVKIADIRPLFKGK